MKEFKKYFIIKSIAIAFLIGFIYMSYEVTFRAIVAIFDSSRLLFIPPESKIQWSKLSLMGYTSVWMFFVGMVSGVCVGLVDEINNLKKMNANVRSLLATFVIVLIEMISGVILNLWLHLHIWDYSNLKFNLYGQICLLFTCLWFLLTPITFWINDFLKWAMFEDEKTFPNLFVMYKNVLIGVIVSIGLMGIYFI